MTRYLTVWTAFGAWAALMGIIWILFEPKGLSGGTFALLSASGPLFVIVVAMLWRAHQPAPQL
jgi:hypothetical protein